MKEEKTVEIVNRVWREWIKPLVDKRDMDSLNNP